MFSVGVMEIIKLRWMKALEKSFFLLVLFTCLSGAFFEKVILENFVKFTGKQQYKSLF